MRGNLTAADADDKSDGFSLRLNTSRLITSRMNILRRLLLLLLLAVLAQGCAARRGEVFQYATINSLLAGVFDGDLTIAELKRHGDLGIGTFNGIDGELMALDGRFYQIRSDGHVYPATDTMRTPFATVTHFEPTRTLVLTNVPSLHALEQQLDALLPNKNAFQAFRIEAEVEQLKTRAVPRQQPSSSPWHPEPMPVMIILYVMQLQPSW